MNVIKITTAVITASVLVYGTMSIAKAAGLNGFGGTTSGSDMWTGCHVGGSVGMGAVNTDANFANYLRLDLGGDGVVAGGLVGCDMKVSDNMLVGIWGDYSWMNMDSNIRVLGYNIGIDYDNQWSVGGRLGTFLDDDLLAYVLVGYSGMDTSKIKGLNVSVGDFSGYTVGGGLEKVLGGNLRAGLEYRYYGYDSESATIYGHRVRFDPDVQTARVTLKWQLWGTPEEVIPLK